MKKKIVRKTKHLDIRGLESKDFGQWRAANIAMAPCQSRWDLRARPKRELTKSYYGKILRTQKEREEQDVYYSFGLFKKDGTLVGYVTIMEVARGLSHSAYLGYRIFNNHWGHGYAKEAVRAVIDIGFKDLKLHRIEAGIEPGNERSIAIAKSCKMRREGLKKRCIFLREKWVDLWIYTLTCEDLGLKFRGSKPKPFLR